jgi:two-component system invasion response regulator UvrY
MSIEVGVFPPTSIVVRMQVRQSAKRSAILSGILVVDDHPVIAKACGIVLEPIGADKIISARDVNTGYQAFVEHEPDISIIDLSLDGEELDGIALIKRIRSRNADAKILVFSMRSDRSSFMSAIEAGATGYLIKDSPTEEFAKAVQQTQLGRRYIDPQLALNLAFPRNAALSARERRILDLLLEDMTQAAVHPPYGDQPRNGH